MAPSCPPCQGLVVVSQHLSPQSYKVAPRNKNPAGEVIEGRARVGWWVCRSPLAPLGRAGSSAMGWGVLRGCWLVTRSPTGALSQVQPGSWRACLWSESIYKFVPKSLTPMCLGCGARLWILSSLARAPANMQSCHSEEGSIWPPVRVFVQISVLVPVAHEELRQRTDRLGDTAGM